MATQHSTKDAKEALPSGYRLVSSAPQGERIRMSGVIRPVGFGVFRPAAYRVIADTSGFPRRTSAYLISDEINWLPHVDKDAIIVGNRFWLFGVREPVIVVDALQ
jgi:hypothetical protein